MLSASASAPPVVLFRVEYCASSCFCRYLILFTMSSTCFWLPAFAFTRFSIRCCSVRAVAICCSRAAICLRISGLRISTERKPAESCIFFRYNWVLSIYPTIAPASSRSPSSIFSSMILPFASEDTRISVASNVPVASKLPSPLLHAARLNSTVTIKVQELNRFILLFMILFDYSLFVVYI